MRRGRGNLDRRELRRAAGKPARKRAVRPREEGPSPRPRPGARGRFELADKGTHLSRRDRRHLVQAMQAKLLRVLQEKRFERVGGHESHRRRASGSWRRPTRTSKRRSRTASSVKICITDLNVIKIDMPPLRDRPEDIPLLIQHFGTKLRPRANELPKKIARRRRWTGSWPTAGRATSASWRTPSSGPSVTTVGDTIGRREAPAARHRRHHPGREPPVRDRPRNSRCRFI